MNRSIALIAATSFIILASCSAKPAADAAYDAANATSSVATSDSSPQKIALSFNMGITLPEDKIDLAMRTDRANCENAGADICQVLSYNFNNSPSDVSANLQIRAVPAWLSPFRDAHAAEMKKLGGQVTSERADAENLTGQIQSGEKTLRDLTLNRDRLLEQINQKAFKGEDLLEAQDRLAEIQRQISETSAHTNSQKARVDMSSMSLDYYTKRGGIDRHAIAPVKEAFASFFDFFFRSFSVLIYIFAVILPFFAAWLVFLLLQKPIIGLYRKINPKKPQALQTE